MISIHLKTHAGPDGTVNLTVPTGFHETDLDVLVVLNPVEATGQNGPAATAVWPAGFFEETYGSCQQEPLIRPPQAKPDTRSSLK
jgi:hypothetical protein